jgi:hypothetical protein
MCDFRHIQEIQLLDTGELIDTTDTKSVGSLTVVTEPGLYAVACTGSYHAYYDGTKWYYEDNWKYRDHHYTVTKFTESEYILGKMKHV